MFGYLKEKLKSAVDRFSSEVDEESPDASDEEIQEDLPNDSRGDKKSVEPKSEKKPEISDAVEHVSKDTVDGNVFTEKGEKEDVGVYGPDGISKDAEKAEKKDVWKGTDSKEVEMTDESKLDSSGISERKVREEPFRFPKTGH